MKSVEADLTQQAVEFQQLFETALTYDDFLARYGSRLDQGKWAAVYDAAQLSANAKNVLGSFQRKMRVLCMAGAWCGDCVAQCPIWKRFADENDLIKLRFLDRDDCPQLASRLTICGAARVPQVVFLSEEGHFVARAGDRTLTKYRQMHQQLTGAACATGMVSADDQSFQQIIQEWLETFERAQLILRTSPRLRQKHGD